MELIEALNWRYAVKQFSNQQVTDEQLKQLLDATRLSASSYGLQPYKIIVIESLELRKKLIPFSYGQEKVAHSSHLIVFAIDNIAGDATVDRYIDKHAQTVNKPHSELGRFSDHMKSALAVKSPEQKQEWAHQQAYIALGNLLTSAAIMKIDSCPMTGFDNEGYDKILGLKEKGLATSVICPIGYRHEDDNQAESPKVRFDYNDIVMEI
jgi:nitroreductase